MNNDAGRNKTKKKGKAVYALLKEHLEQALHDMESWQRRFDPSWYLILRVASERIDKELDSAVSEHRSLKPAYNIRDSLSRSPKREVHVALRETELESAKIGDVSLSTARIMHRATSAESFILDTLLCSSAAAFHQRKKAVRDITQKLTNADPAKLALLKCAGFVPSEASNQFTLVFRVPDGMSNPQSLRTLISQEHHHSLSDRFRLITQLATAVCSVHTLGFVHKNIRPENVLIFRAQGSSIGSGFLLGFEDLRPDEGYTQFIVDTDWEKNIYRHPQRQGLKLRDPYVMQHDIYSLGVCLLEIGLWTSFVQYPDNCSMPMRSQDYKLGAGLPTEAEKAEAVKSELLALAFDPLPKYMGSKYAKVV
ncbi:MAG: hypothetical protein M1821_008389 [Bathelium mastoideum]|nr:MAG: hypothetical protein M1821_008389 [Bathelium mastoideum]